MSLRKPLAACAAVMAAFAIAGPATNASAATVPTSRTAWVGFGSGSLYCQTLFAELRFAALTGNVPAENFLGEVFVYSRCGGAAI
jgi:hypothetical protein